jgi:urease accessory protein
MRAEMKTQSAFAVRTGAGLNAQHHIHLTYEDRYLRRKVLTTADGLPFLVDLPETTSVHHGDAFELEDGMLIGIVAADEALIEITAGDVGDPLARIAWHIGNRHTPCQIKADRLLIQRDHVLEDMFAKLGATVRHVTEPFQPEGGAYGHGRTHGHSHGHNAHADPNAHIPHRHSHHDSHHGSHDHSHD